MGPDIDMVHHRVVRFCELLKEEITRTHGTSIDLNGLVVVGKDGEYIGAMTTDTNRDQAMATAQFLATTAGPDTLTVAIEAYVKLDVAPDADYEHGDFAQAFATDPTVGECVMVVTFARDDGDELTTMCSYKYQGRKIKWDRREKRLTSAGRAQGDALTGDVWQVLRNAVDFELPEEVELLRDEMGLPKAFAMIARMMNEELELPAAARSGKLHEVLPLKMPSKRTRP